MRVFLLLLLLTITACKNNKQWSGGEINTAGNYKYGDLEIIVEKNDRAVDYSMLNLKGDTLVKSENRFSPFQRWALYLDDDKTLWVFSSDIGDICWKKDSVSHKYVKHEFLGLIPKDSIPADVFETLRKFYPYNKQDK